MDPYMWNTAILQGENRGCQAEGCHSSLIDAAPQLLPMSHPKLWNPYNVDASLKFCYMCHSKALFLQDSMHALAHEQRRVRRKGRQTAIRAYYIDPIDGRATRCGTS